MFGIRTLQEPAARVWTGVSSEYLTLRVKALSDDDARLLGKLMRTGDALRDDSDRYATLITAGLVEFVGEEGSQVARPTLAGAAVYGVYAVLSNKRIDQYLNRVAKERPIGGQ